MGSSFSIAFRGELIDGFDPDDVRERFAARFGMRGAALEKLFSGARVVLKRSLDEAEAAAYARQMAGIGLRVVAEAERAPRVVVPAPVGATGGKAGGDFRVLYSGGIAAGRDRDAVMAAARRRLKLGDAQIEAIFSGREMTLKRGLDEAGARKYVSVLAEVGMVARSEPPLAPAEPGPEPGFAATALPTDDEDDVERRLRAAMNAEFDLPTMPASAHRAPGLPTDTDLAMASHHMVETVLNADAMQSYGDLAEGGRKRTESSVADEVAELERQIAGALRPLAPPPSPSPEAVPTIAVVAASQTAAPTLTPTPTPTPTVAPPPAARPSAAPSPEPAPPPAATRPPAAAAPRRLPPLPADLTQLAPDDAPEKAAAAADDHSSDHALARSLNGMVTALFVALLIVLAWVLLGI